MRKFVLNILMVLTAVSLSVAQVHISGELSGTLEDTTYIVDDDIFVSNGASLIIEAGAELLFDGEYEFVINGGLECVGSESDSIIFRPNDGIDSWLGIKFNDFAADSSLMEYCMITGSSAAGIKIIYSSPTISHCLIIGNEDENGGGIRTQFSNSLIENCRITDNSAESYGGGIYAYHNTPQIKSCIFADNSANIRGGGLYAWMCNAHIENCTFSGNLSANGGGIAFYYSTAAVVNTIVEGSLPGSGIHFSNSEDTSVEYCDIYGNQLGHFSGIYGSELGLISQVNTNGDSCDIFFNVFQDPYFVDKEGGDYNLIYTSVCIDAGDPALPLDPDSTISDIGYYFFDQSIPHPPIPFDLLSPGAGDTCWTLDTLLIWEASLDPNTQLPPCYDVWLDTVSDLSSAWMVADSIPDTTLQLLNLLEDRMYYWTVRATDNNTSGTWANDTLFFLTYFPQPLEAFSLLEPENGATLEWEPTLFRWEESFDPDPGDVVTYTLWFVEGQDSIGYPAGESTQITVRPDTVDILEPGTAAQWYIMAESQYPLMELPSTERFGFQVSSILNGNFADLPEEFRFSGCYPNPFNSRARIEFAVPYKSTMKLTVFDLTGREIAQLYNGELERGWHFLDWEAENLASGVYFVEMKAKNYYNTKKVILLR